MITTMCDKGCCSVTHCPLELAFGMTLHTFQGQAAGPVEPGQPKNAVDTAIIDPGSNMFEGSNPGLLYMAASRATTMGSEDTDKPMDSAVYWTGINMNKGRILNLTMQRDGQTKYKKVKLREKWVERLEKNTIKPHYSEQQINEIIDWSKEFKMDKSDLENALHNTQWRANICYMMSITNQINIINCPPSVYKCVRS